MFKELMQLIKMLFQSSPKECSNLEIIQMKHFPFSGYSAMSWCGKLITKKPNKIDNTTITHETIHLKQAQQYEWWILYYIKYVMEWIKGKPFIKPYNVAYYINPFEVEAYANEDNSHYINGYDKNNLKNKYSFKDRRKKYLSFKNFYEWQKYIKEL